MPDAAARLGMGPRDVYRLIDQGQIAAYKLGRVIRLRRSDVEAFLDRNGQPLARPASAAPIECAGKYRPLWVWLRADEQRERAVSFSELERLLGFPLPSSSRSYTAHWYSYASSSVARAIIDAAWHVSRVDLSAETVVLAPGRRRELRPRTWCTRKTGEGLTA